MSTATAASTDDEAQNDTNNTSVATDNSNASTAAASSKKLRRPRMGAVDVDWLFSAQADNPLVTIKCGKKDKSFVVLKLVLTRNSDFFQKCLKEPWAESRTSIVHLPDIKPTVMELYITLATRQALMNTASKDDTLVRQEDFLRPGNPRDHLTFYKACDYLQNKELAKSVQEMIYSFLGDHIAPRLNDQRECYFELFADCFDMLQPSHPAQLRLQRRFVKAFCLRVSFEVYFKHCKVIRERHAFVFEVTQQLALNAMWRNPSTKAKADDHKTQRMGFSDDSETEE